jgi:hypothetical protein
MNPHIHVVRHHHSHSLAQMRSLMLAALLTFPSLGDRKSLLLAQSWIDMELCEPPTLHADVGSDSALVGNAGATQRGADDHFATDSFSSFALAPGAINRHIDGSTPSTGGTAAAGSAFSNGRPAAAGTVKHVGHSVSAADAMRAIDEMMGERARCARDSNQRYVLSC